MNFWSLLPKSPKRVFRLAQNEQKVDLW